MSARPWTQANKLSANLFNLPTNPANTSPMFHAGKLLALCEGGAPIEVRRCNSKAVEHRVGTSQNTCCNLLNPVLQSVELCIETS